MNDPIVAAQVKRADLAWWSALSSSADRQAFLQAWVALQASQLADLRHGALILGEPDTGPFEVAAATPAGSRPGRVSTTWWMIACRAARRPWPPTAAP